MAGIKGMLVKNPGRTARQQAWQSMRIFIEFSQRDILATADIKPSNLNKFIGLLKRHGYVDVAGGSGVSGQRNYQKSYLLVRDTGPTAPIVYRETGLRDLNSGELFAPAGGEKL